MKLTGKIALITGGTSGIGAATATLFQAEGATVIVTGGTSSGIEAARKAMAGVEVIQSDASDSAAAKALIDQVTTAYGRIDVLFVNAGIARMIALEKVEETTFDHVFNTNLRGPYFLLKYASSILVDGASIILTSSSSALLGMPGLSVYAATKAALRSLGMSLAVELAPRRIRVNTITPGPIETPIGGKMNVIPEETAGLQTFNFNVPLKRMGRSEEIAAAALYFASDESRFTTGAELRIDSGMTLV